MVRRSGAAASAAALVLSMRQLCHTVFVCLFVAVVNSVDFVSRNGDSVVFRTCREEADKVIFQIGTADAVLALKAAETVCVRWWLKCHCIVCEKLCLLDGRRGSVLIV